MVCVTPLKGPERGGDLVKVTHPGRAELGLEHLTPRAGFFPSHGPGLHLELVSPSLRGRQPAGFHSPSLLKKLSGLSPLSKQSCL